jgi:hypothetical protein
MLGSWRGTERSPARRPKKAKGKIMAGGGVIVQGGCASLARLGLGITSFTSMSLRLYTNNYTPTVTDTLSNYTELSGVGYSAFTYTPGTWSVTGSGGVATASYPAHTFALTGAATVYGYFMELVLASGSTLFGAELFSSGPFVIPSGGGSITITTNWTLQNG